MKSTFPTGFLLLSLLLTFSSPIHGACNYRPDRGFDNKCTNVRCYADLECESHSCNGFCESVYSAKPWIIAVIVVSCAVALIAIVFLIITCVRKNRTNELAVALQQQ